MYGLIKRSVASSFFVSDCFPHSSVLVKISDIMYFQQSRSSEPHELVKSDNNVVCLYSALLSSSFWLGIWH